MGHNIFPLCFVDIWFFGWFLIQFVLGYVEPKIIIGGSVIWKELQKERVFLSNGLDKGQFEDDQVNDNRFLEDTTVEGSFETSIACMNILVNCLA